MRKLLVLVCALTLAGTVAGCSSSGGSDGADADPTTTTSEAKATTTTAAKGGGDVEITPAEYITAFVTNLSSGSKDDGNLVLTEEQATCVAPKFVDAITAETLNEHDITTDDVADPGFDGSGLGLTEAQGEQLVDAFGACDVDIVALFAESLTMGMTTDQQACAAENVDPDLTRALLVKTFSTGESDAEFEAVIGDLTAACDLPG